MENKPEGQEPQKAPDEEKVALPKAEFEDLKHKAEVSSQNFTRLKKVEEELEQAKAKLLEIPSDSEVFSDEGKALKKEVDDLKSTISELKGTLTKREIQEQYPVFKDKWVEFEEFRQSEENKGMNLKTAAKAFLVEKDLIVESPTRKGLEKPTGGPKNAPFSPGKVSAEDAERLRKTNFKEYLKVVQSGKLQIE